MLLRPARYRDDESVGEFLDRLSPDSRLRRFFNPLPYVSPALTRKMVTNAPGHLVLLAIDEQDVVGHGMAVCIGERAADVGIVVADAYQRQGIGSRLLAQLTDTTAAVGVTTLCCDVLSENYLVLDWLRRALPGIRFRRSGSTMSARWVNLAQR
ncbi:MAG TPA: GNAT family N-acetyltransferase [Pseudonocardiaceae bacterium]|nr:GNAT family N-acetyltransferase [Pseudonocardiaceae bacterium]